MTSRTAVLAAFTLLLPTSPLAAQERFTLEDQRVAVYNLAGEVRVVPGSGSQVTVTVNPGGADARELSVEVDRIRGRTTLRVIYPGDRVVYPMEGRSRWRHSLELDDDGTWGGSVRGGRRVQIAGAGSGLEAHADLEIQVPEGSDLAVYQAVGRIQAGEIRGNLTLDTSLGPVEAHDVLGNVNVDTGSGEISVRGIMGEVTLDTGSGSVEVQDVEGPLVWVDTGSGDVRGRDLRAGRLEVDTGSGRVELMEIRAPEILVDTGSGSVELDILSAIEDVEVDTGSGRVTLTLPRDLDVEVELGTGSGGIEVGLPMDIRRRDRNDLQGVMGSGAGRLVVDTGSGGIQLRGRS